MSQPPLNQQPKPDSGSKAWIIVCHVCALFGNLTLSPSVFNLSSGNWLSWDTLISFCGIILPILIPYLIWRVQSRRFPTILNATKGAIIFQFNFYIAMLALLFAIGIALLASKSERVSAISLILWVVLLLPGLLFPIIAIVKSVAGVEYQYPLHARTYPFYGKFIGLRTAPRELWIIYAAYIFENLAYKVGAAGVLTLWLSSDLGFGDKSAGVMVAVWSAIMTLITVMIGSLTDTLGIRKTFLLGFWVCLAARIVMTLTADAWVVIPFGLYFQAVGIALLIPVMAAACKKYTNAFQRSVAFSLYYALMNLGYAIGDSIFDHVRAAAMKHSASHVEHAEHVWSLTWHGVLQCPYQVLIFLSVVFTIPGLILVWFTLREGVEMTESGVQITPRTPKAAGNPLRFLVFFGRIRVAAAQTCGAFSKVWRKKLFRWLLVLAGVVASAQYAICIWTAHLHPNLRVFEFALSEPFVGLAMALAPVFLLMAFALVFKEVVADTSITGAKSVQLFESLWPQPSFHRFLIFMSLVVGVKMIFYHLSFTFPKFGIRELGEGAPFAHLSGMLNSLMILVLVPICGALTQKISAYRMVTVGSLISALSVFFIAAPPEWFKPLADGMLGDVLVHKWLGVNGPVNPLYISIFFFIVMLSIGEAFWSPRLYEYAAAIAPKGQEASYMALSLLPYFVAKFTVGLSSGWLLSWFCPDEPLAHGIHRAGSGWMWFIIGCTALITPIGTFLFRKHLQLQESGREPVITKVEGAAEEEDAGHG